MFLNFYRKAVIAAPRKTLFVMLLIGAFFLVQSQHFFLDASSDSLMLQNDPELREFRRIHERYGSGDSLLAVTFTPDDGELFTTNGLDRLRSMRGELNKLKGVSSVVTLLDVPLFRNPPVPVSRIVENVKTLDDPDVDIDLAQEELMASEAYEKQLISSDGRTALIALYVEPDKELKEIRDKRNACQIAVDRGEEVGKNRAAFEALTPELRRLQKQFNRKVERLLIDLRKTVKPFRKYGDIRIGGELMVSDDMLSFIRHDLKVFGVAIFVCITVILTWFFRRKRWVLAAVICCAYSTVVMTGLLGFLKCPVTVISSNFISLLLIMNMSLVIHLVVQYRELLSRHKEMNAGELLQTTVARKWRPSLYTTLTTIAGFSSLILCDIKPVRDFGLMMSLALVVSITVSFIIFPSLLMLFKKEQDGSIPVVGQSVIDSAAAITEKKGAWIIAGTCLLIVFIFFGIQRLTVENSFVNYFKKSTDIYRGMVFLDKKLGGTVPLDVTVSLNEISSEQEGDIPGETSETADAASDEFDEFDEFEDAGSSSAYWYTPAKLEVVRKAHSILEKQPEIGKVWSLTTLLRITDTLNDGVPLDAFDLAIMAEKLPEYARDLLVTPFVSIEDNQFRVSARVYDSMPELRRDSFLKRIEKELNEGLDLPPGSIVVNGTMVLYNSVLQSLFRSQILTLGIVFLVLLFMFLILFRSFKLALIALFPNLISALTVLGLLGAAGIPLDIMTITIASISIGIAVDDTIHYIHRFREEFRECGNYHKSMRAAHNGVGSAMFYTSFTIVSGYMLLVFSNFIPSILFGVLSSVAMVVALVGALTLLPKLIIMFQPFGPEKSVQPSGLEESS
ncbi:MAG: MMPL family transporter [Kiritimatiellia bacterium]